MAVSQNLTQTELRRVLQYKPRAGVFHWKTRTSMRVKPGSRAGSIAAGGYISIKINGKNYAAHRLAWLYVHGVCPGGLIDHINGDPADNKIANLRIADRRGNRANSRASKHNKSGVKGVQCRKGRWRAIISVGGETRHLGTFDTASQANAVYFAAAKKEFGEFARAA